MTFPTANMRIETPTIGIHTNGFHLNLLFSEWKRTYKFWI